jgi:hypothetical protein
MARVHLGVLARESLAEGKRVFDSLRAIAEKVLAELASA